MPSGARLLTKAIFLPSGDHELAPLLTPLPWLWVSCRRPLPSARITYTFDDENPKSGLLKTSFDPSGEQSILSAMLCQGVIRLRVRAPPPIRPTKIAVP